MSPSPSYVPLRATGGPSTFSTVTATSYVLVDSDGTAINAVDRGSITDYAAYVLRTNGTDRWAIQMVTDSDLKITDSANGVTVMQITPNATTPVTTLRGTLAQVGATSATVLASGIVANDTFDRWRMDAAGTWTIGPGNATRDVTVRRSAAGVLATDGDFALATVGGRLMIKEGANATSGAVTLAAGTATISSTKITATSRIQLTVQSLGTVTAPKPVAITARTPGTSATVTSADATDTSVVAWVIVEPAA